MLLFVILWLYARKVRPTMAVSAVFLMGYGVLRFLAEFAREPDDFGLVFGLLDGATVVFADDYIGRGFAVVCVSKEFAPATNHSNKTHEFAKTSFALYAAVCHSGLVGVR